MYTPNFAPTQPRMELGAAPEEIARVLDAVARLDALPTLLEVLCDTTGLRFAAVARVTDSRWIACAVKDDIDLGVLPGHDVAVQTTPCAESRSTLAPVLVEHASADPRYHEHATPRLHGFESYVSVPIVMPEGRYFGNLCAFDQTPADLSDPRILSMFQRFATLIGRQLDRELNREMRRTALFDERATSELREQFIGILGHDLRNPLQAIYATSDMLERRLDAAVDKDMAGRIKTNVRRMSALIDDVLDFARSRLGRGIGLHMTDIAAGDVVNRLLSVIRELEDALPLRRIVADMRLTSSVHGNTGRLQQLVSNLVANALTHGSPDSVVRVIATNDDEFCTLRVWNDGDPIPAANLGKVFEPFWRHSTPAGRNGLGLGLYICDQIVQAHHGHLSVSSDAASGTTFTARLPLRPPLRSGGAGRVPQDVRMEADSL